MSNSKDFKCLSEILPLPVDPKNKRYFGSLPGIAKALTLANIVQQHQGLVLAIVEDSLMASRLEAELNFFLRHPKEEGDKEGELALTLYSFPAWETLPYDSFSPHQDIISERLTTLYRLPELKRGILIVPVATLMHYLPPVHFLKQYSLLLNLGETLNLDKFRQSLIASGYRNTHQVMEHGEFAIRGSILDLFPMGSREPYRIDLLGEVVDSIRTFDIETQRSLEKVDHIHLLPAREFPLNEEAIAHFRTEFRNQFEGDPRDCPVYLDVSEGLASPGLEYYLPLFFQKLNTLFDYLPSNSLIVGIENIEKEAESFWEQVKERYEQYRYDRKRPLLEPKALFLPTNEFFGMIKKFPFCQLTDSMQFPSPFSGHFQKLPDVAVNQRLHLGSKEIGTASLHSLTSLQTFLNEFKGPVLMTAETLGRQELLKELLSTLTQEFHEVADFQEFLSQQHQWKYCLTVAELEEGLIWKETDIDFSQQSSLSQLSSQQPLQSQTFQQFAIIPESDLFGKRVMQKRLRKTRSPDFDFEVRSLAELTVGAPIVHIDYGIGRYLGLNCLTLSNMEAEFLTIEYAGGDKIYVPVTSLHLVSRYSGVDLEHAPLNRLGSGQWEKVKRKVLEETRDVAGELLEIYAKRKAKQGFQFQAPDEEYLDFSSEFPFEETPDQERAIKEVINDLISQRPMDRVVCGDVGFGKTEVALRAAFLVSSQGKQVAVLVPTTLLAEQHFQTFNDRFSHFPIRIEVLSRFKTTKEQDAIINDLKEGKIDIIIGTHKLLQPSIHFQRLGLLIIDEEHRFGVRQKETFKRLRSEVDILTLTATPIPRTLNMAMTGMRDLSIIATPPARRLSIKTFVREKSAALITEAIQRELNRGGQVYFLHNEVETIENVGYELQNLVPSARIAIAHGQMRERELEQIMSDFYHRRTNVLVCTTIIETGIDIPTANTIIIDRADKFGLAQLHQLRGRVGRSHHQAYAFCLTPQHAKISTDATKRLEAIGSLGELGVGFTLATHDLEIRGAGELLGEEQSGNIQSVGFPLFMELLDHAVKIIESGEEITEDNAIKKEIEIDLHVPALIPTSYLPDVHSRLLLYKRIASCKNQDSLDDLKSEMIDRFGNLPPQTQNLFKITELKLKASPMGIIKIEANPKGGRIEFNSKPNIDANHLIRLIQEKSHIYRFDGPHKLRIREELPDPNERVQAVLRWVTSLVS